MNTNTSPEIRSSASQLAQELCRAGNDCLVLAKQVNFQDPELLEKASECFITALGLPPPIIEAYLGLAFLCSLTGLFSKAEDILLQAQNIQAKDPRLAALAKEIRRLKQTSFHVDATQLSSLYQILEQIPFQGSNSEIIKAIDQKLAPKLNF